MIGKAARPGVKVQCPMLVLWGSKGSIGKWYDAPAIWGQYCAAEVTGAAIDSGHYIAEESPDGDTGALPAVLRIKGRNDDEQSGRD